MGEALVEDVGLSISPIPSILHVVREDEITLSLEESRLLEEVDNERCQGTRHDCPEEDLVRRTIGKHRRSEL